MKKKIEIRKGTNTFSQQLIYNGALAKEKKVVPVDLKTSDRHTHGMLVCSSSFAVIKAMSINIVKTFFQA